MAKSAKREWFNVLKQLMECKAFPGMVHRLLLYGPPGMGKSRVGQLIAETLGIALDKVERVPLDKCGQPDDLLGGWLLANGTTLFNYGPAVRAAKGGFPLVLDEVDRLSPDCRSLVHALMDDREMCQLHLPSGEVVKPAQGFCVIGTTNAKPDALPDAILDRFELILHADQPAPGLLKSIRHDGVRNWLANKYSRITTAAFTVAGTARRCLSVDKLLSADVPLDLACLAAGLDQETANSFAVAAK